MSSELFDLMRAEESLYRQKSKVQWLREGDLNTRFFHSMVKARQKAQSFIGIEDISGKACNNHEEVATAAVEFFQNLIGKEDSNVERCPVEFLKELLPNSLLSEAADELARPVVVAEIKEALFFNR